MTSSSKRKGNGFEREVVDLCKEYAIEAKRAYASNGQSLGHHEEVDVRLILDQKDFKVQCKRRRKIPDFLGFTEHVDAVVFKEDRGRILIMLELADFLSRVKG